MSNRYDKNFDGQFCICERGKTYDPDTETEDMYQCLACEDWRHASCLGPHPDADDWDDLICADCVQNNPTIKSILFKHAGGEGTGMMVCGDSGTDDGPGRVICYGRLLDPSVDSKLEPSPPPNLENPQVSSANGCLLEGSLSIETEKKKQHIEYEEEDSYAAASSIPPTILDPSTDRSGVQTKQETQEPPRDTLNESRDSSKVNENGELEKTRSSSVLAPDKKRSGSVNPENAASPSSKKPRVERERCNPNDRHEDGCRAPFKHASDSILNRIEPGFSNVFLAEGWRTRWCRCPDCLVVLRGLNWLIEEEEDVWEPGEDTDSLKSIHELGLEALKKLPREQLVEGMNAYNKLKQQMLDFLKPFESQNLLVTEQDIRQFFSDTKDKIHNRSW